MSIPPTSPLSEISDLSELSTLSGLTVVNMPTFPTVDMLSTHTCDQSCSDGLDGESSSDSEDYNYNSDDPLRETVARIRGGALRRSNQLRQQRKPKKPCLRNGGTQPRRSKRIRSGVVEGAEGPLVPEEMAAPEGTGGEDNGEDNSNGTQETVTQESERVPRQGKRKRKGRSGKKGPRTRPRDEIAMKWEMVLKAATTAYATPLLARLCVMSGRNERSSLHQLVCNLEADPSQLSTSRPASRTHWLNRIVDSIELATSVAKVTELFKIFGVMNLAMELDQ